METSSLVSVMMLSTVSPSVQYHVTIFVFVNKYR